MGLNPKWLSHGLGSSLMEHTAQVLAMAETFAERVAAICHDVGKATIPWQDRARRNFRNPDGTLIRSPHSHAEWGGILAYFVLQELDCDLVTKAAALQAVAAHHSHLGTVETTSDIVFAIGNSTEALEFAIEAFRTFLPQISAGTVKKAWLEARQAFAYGEIDSLYNDKDFSDADKLRLILSARRMLGKLVLFDTRSAANQDPKVKRPFRDTLPAGPIFRQRPVRKYGQNRLSTVRDSLKEACLSMAPGVFYSIDAPTGTGKTEAMLSLAEKIARKENKKAIVYAVPQISICEQIVADYMSGVDAQVWNFKIRQKLDQESNADDQDTRAAVLESPFSSSYNITTFNQVVLSIAHPHRNHCVRSLWLKDAVIIMDEIHKLPLHCLLYFIRLAELFAEQNNCTWIFGSATPLPDSDKIFRDIQISKLNDEISSSLKESPLLYERRVYQRIEDQNAESVAELIRHRASGDGQNLVLLSLVEKGTFAVAKILGIPTDPWNRIFTGLNPKHPIVWLDGSVPPLLREHYLSFVKSRVNSGLPVTLLTTQIVEVGVDLDFDAGYTDLISLASILQRGGRVARESRSDERPRYVHLFNFKTIVNERGVEVEKTTKEILDTVALGSVMLTEQAAAKIRLLLTNSQYRVKTYFSCWQHQKIKKEIELIEANAHIAIQELQAIEDPTISDIVTVDLQHAHVGLTLQHLETITQLYGDEPHGESVVLFESSEEVEVVQDLFSANQEKLGYQELAKRRAIIHPNLVASLLSENFLEREVHWWTDRTVVKADNIV